MSKFPIINYVVALDAEAQPIIRHYKLKRNHEISSFAVYRKDNIQLIVSGIGKYNAAVATGYLAGITESRLQLWINFGIAGGISLNVGDMALASSILDVETKRCYYPSICFDVDLPNAQVATLNEPSETYRDGVLYDMEASGYFIAASRFSTIELVHCIKVVSDNSINSLNDISKKSTLALVESCIGDIDKVSQALLKMAEGIRPDQNAEQAISLLVEKYHFTTSQKNTLRLMVQNWFAINSEMGITEIQNIKAKNVSQFLDSFSQMIKSQSVKY